MTYTFVSSSFVSNTPITYTSPHAGNLLVFASAQTNEFVSLSSLSDGTNVWNSIGNINDGNNVAASSLAYAENVAGSTVTITPTWNNSPTNYILAILEYSNIITSGSNDFENDNGDSAASSINIGPNTTQAANELIVAIHHTTGNRTTVIPTGTGLSFTQRLDILAGVVNNDFAVYDSAAATAQAYTVTFGTGGTSGGNMGLIAGFRTTAGPAVTIIPATVSLVGNQFTQILGKGNIV